MLQFRYATQTIYIVSVNRLSVVLRFSIISCNNIVSVKMYSYPKGNRNNDKRSARPVKRKFYGNQYSNNEENSVRESATARKLSAASNKDVCITTGHFYRIIEFMTVFGTLSQILICKMCKSTVQFQEASHRGLRYKIVVKCSCAVNNSSIQDL